MQRPAMGARLTAARGAERVARLARMAERGRSYCKPNPIQSGPNTQCLSSGSFSKTNFQKLLSGLAG